MKEKSPYNIFTLSNGMRCVQVEKPGNVEYIGVIVGAGSRDEAAGKYGLAHFVEHTIFKGTRHRSSWRISNRMESVGGELNAYTSKEETVVYTAAPSGNAERAIELLFDLLAYSCFPESELEKEREVVIEEIKSYLDSPSERVFDEFEDRIYAGSSPGHNILGSAESVKDLRGEDCRGFLDRYYVPGNMTLYAVGSTKTSKIQQLAEKYFGKLRLSFEGHQRSTPVLNSCFNDKILREGYQAHTLMGSRVCDRNSEKRFSLFLLNNYLGGPCMNSLFNQELRERRGLVYTVDSTVGLMSDCGLWQVYFGSDLSQVERCKRLVRNKIEDLSVHLLSDRKFNSMKRQYAGQLLVGSDHAESMAMSLGKSLLYYNKIMDLNAVSERIMALRSSDILDAAVMIGERGLSSLTIE